MKTNEFIKMLTLSALLLAVLMLLAFIDPLVLVTFVVNYFVVIFVVFSISIIGYYVLSSYLKKEES